MTSSLLARLCLIALLLQLSCSGAQRTANPHRNSAFTHNDITMSNNTFAFELFSALERNTTENLVLSPFSISTAMAMVYPGSAGETARQFSQTMHFNPAVNNFTPEFAQWAKQIEATGAERKQFSVANALWPHKGYPFHQEYIELINTWFRSAFFPVDYLGDREAIRQKINQWVAAHTNDLIRDLIQPGVLVEDTRLVLVNAIYFLSAWQTAFDKQATHQASFFVEPGRSVQTSMMYMKHPLPFYQGRDFKLLELPYEGDDFSMLVLLPSEGNTLSSILEKWDGPLWDNEVNKLSMQEVEVFFPSFSIRSRLDLEKTLIAMGMPDAFSNKADFSAMTPLNDLKIDKVIHQAYIEVKEEGTEAAASTAVVMIRKTAIADPVSVPVFRADRPFLYVIRERSTNAILFMGKTQNPTLQP